VSKPSPLTTWCRLLRLPNLFTVPGDPLAGFMLATGGVLDWRVAGAMATSLLLYSAGLLLNDYFDRHVDARERPERPIPSGAVKARTVLAIGLILLAAGVGVAFAVGHAGAGAVAIALALAVFGYDAWLKRVRWLGPLVMGACRAASVVLGATFACRPMAPPVVVAAGIVWAYIAAVTVLAARETSSTRPRHAAFVPGGILAAGIVVLWMAWRPKSPLDALLPLFLLTGATVGALVEAARVVRGKTPVPPFIGELIRYLILVQAAWAIWPCGHTAHAYAVLGYGSIAWWSCAGFASSKFYGS